MEKEDLQSYRRPYTTGKERGEEEKSENNRTMEEMGREVIMSTEERSGNMKKQSVCILYSVEGCSVRDLPSPPAV